jgi:hypothetical protein
MGKRFQGNIKQNTVEGWEIYVADEVRYSDVCIKSGTSTTFYLDNGKRKRYQCINGIPGRFGC